MAFNILTLELEDDWAAAFLFSGLVGKLRYRAVMHTIRDAMDIEDYNYCNERLHDNPFHQRCEILHK